MSILGFGSNFNATSENWNGTVRQKYSRVVSGGKTAHTPQEVEAFVKVRELLLDSEIKKGVIGGGEQNQIDDFTINAEAFTARYTDAKGVERSIDLYTVNDPEIVQAINYLFFVAKINPNKRKPDPSSKGNFKGSASCQRSTDALRALPRTIDENYYKKTLPKQLKAFKTSSEKSSVVNRLLFAEKYPKDLSVQLKNRVKEKRAEWGKAQAIEKKKSLGEEIKHLNELISKLDALDTYPLQKVLAYLPVGYVSEGELFNIATKLRKDLEEEILSKKWGIFGFRKQLTEEEEEFIKDIVGALFIERGAYFRYCAKVGIVPKQEGTFDPFIRIAIRFASKKATPNQESQPFYAAEANFLLKDFSETLREEVLDDMHACGVLVDRSIPTASIKGYEEAKDDESKLKEAIISQRKQIDSKLTIDQLKKDSKMYDRSSSSNSLSNAIVPYVGGALVPLALRGGYEWLKGTPQREIIPRVLRHVMECPSPYFVASQVIPPLIIDPKSKAISWKKVGTITAIGFGAYLLAQYAGLDPTVEETWTFTAASWGMWAANQYFKGYMLNGFRKGVSYMIPERAKQKASEAGQAIVAKFPEEAQPVVQAGGNVLLGLGSLWAFNGITNAYAPDYETVASAASWTMSAISSIWDSNFGFF